MCKLKVVLNTNIFTAFVCYKDDQGKIYQKNIVSKMNRPKIGKCSMTVPIKCKHSKLKEATLHIPAPGRTCLLLRLNKKNLNNLISGKKYSNFRIVHHNTPEHPETHYKEIDISRPGSFPSLYNFSLKNSLIL